MSGPNSRNRFSDSVSLASIRSESDDYWTQVLSLCGQSNPSKFGLEFSSVAFDKFEYLDSGTYSLVIKAIDLENGRIPVVFKVGRSQFFRLF